MRKLILFVAAVSLVLSAEKALCYETRLSIEPDSFKSFRYEEMRVEEAALLSIIMGRFLSADSVNGGAEQPQSWNRYAYVRGDPLAKADPDGKNPVAILFSAAVSVGTESIRQIRSDQPADNGRLLAALVGGAISGAIPAIGNSVALGGAVAGVINGGIQRFAAHEKVFSGAVVVDALGGAAGRIAGRSLGKAMVNASKNAGKLNTLMWKAAVERAEAAVANHGLGADKATQEAAQELTEGITRAGGIAGGLFGQGAKQEIKDLQRELALRNANTPKQ